MMKKLVLYLILICFVNYILPAGLSELYAQEEQKSTIAILKLDARSGISLKEAETLSDRLRTELVNTGAFIVLERGQMDEILQEQGFNQSGCISSECAVEAGRLLGVQKMVAGSVGKVGEIYSVEARVFDVETGEILQAHQFDYEGEVSGLLIIMKDVARKIAGIADGGFPWLWVTAGVVAVGTAAILLSGGKDSESVPANIDLPDPQWPPVK
jgi:TolB-like protein